MVQQIVTSKSEVFLNQIKEDIIILQENLKNIDPRILKEEYAFNYWILSRIYSMDEELIQSLQSHSNNYMPTASWE